MAIEPSGERIFDPFLGEERDAFPGEIVPEGQETSFQRALREAGKPYLALYNDVADQLAPDELKAILKAREIVINKKAKELEESFQTNPATVLQKLLLDISATPLPPTQSLLFGLDSSISDLNQFINLLKTEDKVKGREPRSIAAAVDTALKIKTSGITGRLTGVERPNNNDDGTTGIVVLRILKNFGTVPEEIRSLDRVIEQFRQARNSRDSNLPYYTYGNSSSGELPKVLNLAAKKPGLEGITGELLLKSNGLLNYFEITASPDTLKSIAEKSSGFTPFRGRPRA